MIILSLLICALVIIGTANALFTTVEIWRAPGPLCRANVMGTVSTVTFPCYMLAYFLYTWLDGGFSLARMIECIIAIAAILIIGSTATFYMGRAIHQDKHDSLE